MIELSGVCKTYRMGSEQVHALRDVTLKIHRGEFVAIMGASGSGKSTLMHVLGCLDRPDSGSYLLNGREMTTLSNDELAAVRNRVIGFVFQQFHLLPYSTALENVELPLIYAGVGHLGARASRVIEGVGLADRARHRPSELSGGQQQRVAIARALVNDPVLMLADEPTGNLDLHSKEEIITILKDLNKAGKTVVVVTHEQEIAAHAERVIQMSDGFVISDSGAATHKAVKDAMPAPSGEHDGKKGAAFMDFVRQALHALYTHKMRSVLSMLGILIGVAAVIAMLALGSGARESIAQRLASMGTNLLRVRTSARRLQGVALEAGSVARLTLGDVEAIKKIPGVAEAVPSVQGRAQVVYGNKNWNTEVQGTGPKYEKLRASKPTVGRFLTDDEVRSREKVAVLGTTLARELFGEGDFMGAIIKINRVNFKVIGLLPEKGAMGFRDQDDVVIIPISTAMHRLLGKDYVNAIDVEVEDLNSIEEIQTAIQDLIMKRHRISEDNRSTVDIRNMAEMREALESTTRTMTLLLGSIAAISLLVGGIGIMNIMLVSVAERTREIGLRKAVGARNSDIMHQFLIESVVMTMSGGAIGILLGVMTASAMARIAGWAVRVSTYSIILATVFSVAVGMIFGLWPARRAAQLDPVEALRYE